MNRKPRAWSLRAASVAAVGLVSLTAMPAYAAEKPALKVELSGHITLAGPNSAGKTGFAWVTANQATNVTATFDLAGVAKVATALTAPGQCKTTGTKAVCALGNFDERATVPVPVFLWAANNTGAKGDISLTVTADKGLTATAKTTVEIGPDGVDLVADPLPDSSGAAKPGDLKYTPANFYNAGSAGAATTTVTVVARSGMIPLQYDGCTYTPLGTATAVSCTFDQEIPAGEGFRWMTVAADGTTTPGFGTSFAPDAFGTTGFSFTAEAGAETATASLKGTRANSRVHAKLQPVGQPTKSLAEVDKSDNYSYTSYQVANTYDLAAIGGTASGKAGDTVKVNVGIRNNGKGSLDAQRAGRLSDTAATFKVQLPPGTTLASPAAGCASGGTDPQAPLTCSAGQFLGADGTFTLPLELRLGTEVKATATGTVTTVDVDGIADSAPANNTAQIALTTTGGGTGGTGGGAGTGPVAGGLPETGARTGLFAAAGTGLVGLGVGLYLFARRRRSAFVAE